MSSLPNNNVIQYPSGRWGFVGSVCTDLCYMQQDGSPPTNKQLDTARHCGPGFANLRARTFATEADALQAAADLVS